MTTTKINERNLNQDLKDKIDIVGGTTVFNADGSITTAYDNGNIEHTVFNDDGSITTTYNDREIITTFNDDGSITTVVREV